MARIVHIALTLTLGLAGLGLAGLGLAGLGLSGLGLVRTAHADVRSHVLIDPAPDPERLVGEFEAALKDNSLTYYISIDETRNVAQDGTSIGMRHVDYQISRYDGTSITASFFLLVDATPEGLDALDKYVQWNYGYGGSPMRLRDLGTLTWYEWSPSGNNSPETLERDLADWRESYVEAQ